MARSQDTYNKKEVRNQKEKKRKEKEQKRLERKISGKTNSFDDMIAYVDEHGRITSTPPDPEKRTTINSEEIEISIPRRTEEDNANAVRKGVVSFFDDSKNFGFIKDLETMESIYVHASNLTEPIRENNLVNFEVKKGLKGLTAFNVSVFKPK